MTITRRFTIDSAYMLKKVVYRIFFASGVVVFFVLTYFTFSMSRVEYNQFTETEFASTLFFVLGISLLFYMYAIIYACFNVLIHYRTPIFLWLVTIIFLPIVGSFIYFEKYILPVKSPSREETRYNMQAQPDSNILIAEAGWRRIVAVIIDLAIIITVVALYAIYFGAQTGEGEYEVKGFESITLLIAVWFCLLPLPEFLFGGTIGKLVLRIHVMMIDDSKLSFVAPIKRHLLDPIDLVFVTWMVPFPKDGSGPAQRLGDRWARTKVVRRFN